MTNLEFIIREALKAGKRLPSRAIRAELKQLDEQRARLGDLVQQARDLHTSHSNADVEIDDNTYFSEADQGTWVAAWVWVDQPEELVC